MAIAAPLSKPSKPSSLLHIGIKLQRSTSHLLRSAFVRQTLLDRIHLCFAVIYSFINLQLSCCTPINDTTVVPDLWYRFLLFFKRFGVQNKLHSDRLGGCFFRWTSHATKREGKLGQSINLFRTRTKDQYARYNVRTLRTSATSMPRSRILPFKSKYRSPFGLENVMRSLNKWIIIGVVDEAVNRKLNQLEIGTWTHFRASAGYISRP